MKTRLIRRLLTRAAFLVVELTFIGDNMGVGTSGCDNVVVPDKLAVPAPTASQRGGSGLRDGGAGHGARSAAPRLAELRQSAVAAQRT